jgi:hypothetical protein
MAPVRHAITASIVLLGLASSLNTATAQLAPTSAADVERLIRRGTDLRRQGKDQEALPLFQKAHETASIPRTAAQLGLCEMQLGYWLAAEEHLGEALSGRTDAWMQKYRSVLEESLRRVQAQIGEMVVDGTPASAQVSINERPASGRLPLGPIRVVAGRVKVDLRAPGYESKGVTVTVPAKSQVRVSLDLQSIVAKASSTVAPGKEARSSMVAENSGRSKDGWPTRKIVGASLIGTAILAVGGGATLVILDKHETCDAPVPGSMCLQRNQTRLAGWGLVGLGAGLLTVGGILVYGNAQSSLALAASPASIALSGHF